ncbi:MAG: hypothetical protein WD342_16465 [Verrucomicrobiales bacterium]
MSMYWLARDGVSTGPFAPGRLVGMWESGDVGPDDLLALHGTEDWFSADAMLPALASERREVERDEGTKARRVKEKDQARSCIAMVIFLVAVVGLIASLLTINLIGIPVSVAFICLALIVDRRRWLCGGCGNGVEKSSAMCPVCRARLTN